MTEDGGVEGEKRETRQGKERDKRKEEGEIEREEEKGERGREKPMKRNAPKQEQERREGGSKHTHSFYLDTYLRESSVSSLGAVKRRDPHKSMHTGLRLAPPISQWSFQKEEDRTQPAAVLAPGFLYCRREGGWEGRREALVYLLLECKD